MLYGKVVLEEDGRQVTYYLPEDSYKAVARDVRRAAVEAPKEPEAKPVQRPRRG